MKVAFETAKGRQMNFRQLRAFNTVMQRGTITGAARELRVSQPSVTRLIHELEASLGFTLFVRHGRGIVATVEAKRFHQAVESAFINIDRLDDLAAIIRKSALRKLSVGVIPTFSISVLPRVLGDFRRSGTTTHTVIYTRNTPSIVDAVQLQQFDLGIVSRAPPYEGVHILYQTAVNYVALIPAEHKLAKPAGALVLAAIAPRQEFVTFGDVYPLEMMGMEAHLAAMLQANANFIAANMPTAAALVREAGVPAILDPFTARMAAKNGGVVTRPLCQKLYYNIALITRGLDTMTQEARQLSNALIAAFEEDPILRGEA